MNYRTQVLDAARVFWQQHTKSDALSMTMAELHTDVELVIRAARGSAQAAPVDAASRPLTDSQIADIYFEALGSQHLRHCPRQRRECR